MNIIMVDFKLASIKYKAKRLAPLVPRYLSRIALTPIPLDLIEPSRNNENLQICMLLSKSSNAWLSMLYGSARSYARAGMRIGLCEYAACRDALDGLAALEASRKPRTIRSEV